MNKLLLKAITLLLFTIGFLQSQTFFELDSALVHLKKFAETIGPRPAGSLQELRSLSYAQQKFHEYGLVSYIDTFTIMDLNKSYVNGKSGVVVGIKKGNSQRCIVIGAHIDSESPYTPGAIDNASGSACVIELARMLSHDSLNLTIVFCLFGAEEIGTQGSEYFVQTFPLIDSVLLMLQLDMANGNDKLIALVESKAGNTPVSIVRLSDEILDSLGYGGLSYPTNFFTLSNALAGGGIGSDHLPFLQKSIPAICFSSSLNDPFHTPQDNIVNLNTSGLKRSTELTYHLVKRFDHLPLIEKPQYYHLVAAGNYLFFIPLWLLWLFVVSSLIITPVTIALRSNSLNTEMNQRKKVPALQLLFFMFIIVMAGWVSESLVGILKGVRYPWLVDLDLYVLFAIFCSIVTMLFFSKQLLLLFKSHSPIKWYIRVLIVLGIYTVLLLLFNVRLAVYPAVSIFVVGFIVIIPSVIVKIILWFVALYPLIQISFNEGFDMIARMVVLQHILTLPAGIILQLIPPVFFVLWFLPAAMLLAAILSQSSFELSEQFKRWRKKSIIVFAITGVLIMFLLLLLPSHNSIWAPSVKATFKEYSADSATISLESSEYITNTILRTPINDTTIDQRIIKTEIPFSDSIPQWFNVELLDLNSNCNSLSTQKSVKIKVSSMHVPMDLQCSIVTKSKILSVQTPFYFSRTLSTVDLKFVYPDSVLIIPLDLSIASDDTVKLLLEAKFPILPPYVQVSNPVMNVIPETQLRRVLYLPPN